MKRHARLDLSRLAAFCATSFTIVAVFAAPASAQCDPEWTDRFVTPEHLFDSGIDAVVDDLTTPGGPALYVAGDADGTARGVARWLDGRWNPIGAMNGDVRALAVFDDDGGGPNPSMLYAGGAFTTVHGIPASYVARWDGTEWSPVGPGANFVVQSMAVVDGDGAGPNPPALYVGGRFTVIGGSVANGIAKFDGNTWSALGSGLTDNDVSLVSVHDIVVFDDDGSGPHESEIYVTGEFDVAGGVPANSIAKWNGATWSALGSGIQGIQSVNYGYALAAHDDDASGPLPPALYVGGEFKLAGGVAATNMARWDGSTWTALDVALDDHMTVTTAIASFDEDGSGPGAATLIVGGSRSSQAPPTDVGRNLARWNGSAWSAVGDGVNPGVTALRVYDDDGGGSNPPALYVGGGFSIVAEKGVDPLHVESLARWSGTSWSAVGALILRDTDALLALVAHDDDGAGARPRSLFAAGSFVQASGKLVNHVARYDGYEWHALGGGTDDMARALCVYDEDGDGPAPTALYAGGDFTIAGGVAANHIAKWDGIAWTPLGSGVDGNVHALCVHDADGSGPAPASLYVGGGFTLAGGVTANRLARWDGVSWSALGDGTSGPVYALATYDVDGLGPSAPSLYAGGAFASAGGAPANHIARWNGSAWSALGSGVGSNVSALVAYDEDGAAPNGPALFVGGAFTTAGGAFANRVARWNGSAWSAVGLGVDEGYDVTLVSTLGVFDDDGVGPNPLALYAGGLFQTAGTVDASLIARWDGIRWSALDDGIPEFHFTTVKALCVYDEDGSGPEPTELYAGGDFGIESWRGCGSTFESFCFGDGSLATACPCTPPNTVPNPPAATAHGCANSLNLNGARMFASGTTTPDTVQFEVDVAPLYAGFGFISKGNAFLANGEAASDGIRCTSGQLLRFGGHNAGTNGAPIGTWTYPNTAQTISISTATAQTYGQTAYYQLYYRNAAESFCNAATANFSSGVIISWQ